MSDMTPSEIFIVSILRFVNPLAEFLNSEGSWLGDDPFRGLY